jgi:hypothetical protein
MFFLFGPSAGTTRWSPTNDKEWIVATTVPRTSWLDALAPKLINELAQLNHEGRETATIALQLLPFGDRANLKAQDLVFRDDDDLWQFTPAGWSALQVCAEHVGRSQLEAAKESLDDAVTSVQGQTENGSTES